MGDPAAPIMASHMKACEAQSLHHFDLIQRQRPFRIVRVVRLPLGLGAVPITPRISRDNGEMPRETRSNLVPLDVRLRVAVEQQQWRALASDDQIDLGFARFDPLLDETWKQRGMVKVRYIKTPQSTELRIRRPERQRLGLQHASRPISSESRNRDRFLAISYPRAVTSSLRDP